MIIDIVYSFVGNKLLTTQLVIQTCHPNIQTHQSKQSFISSFITVYINNLINPNHSFFTANILIYITFKTLIPIIIN